MRYENRPVVSIVGPTASGKSDLAQTVAVELGGEVVSADSMQIYRGMDIGTAKIPVSERKVPHHLLDVVEPGQAYSAQLFQDAARKAFDEIESRGLVPVLCGGTGFYVQAALDHMDFPKGEQTHNSIRDHWQDFADKHGAEALWSELKVRDEKSAEVVHPNNVRRVIRALEMHEQGVSYAEQVQRLKRIQPDVASMRFGLQVDRDVLNDRIEKRVDKMFELGLVNEVKTLIAQGFTAALTAPQAIGYKEVVKALEGKCSLDEAREDIKAATRRYAKRQRSWFKRDKSIIWLEATNARTDNLCDQIVNAYRGGC